MSLIQDAMVDMVMMEKQRIPDGEGGFTTSWAEGAPFQAAVTYDGSMQARRAEKEGVTSLYTITTAKNAKLEFHDVLKRLSDGKIFRVTSDGDDMQTPDAAMFGQYSQVSAEEWSLAT